MNGLILSLALMSTGQPPPQSQPQIDFPGPVRTLTYGYACLSDGSRIVVPIVNGQVPNIVDVYDVRGRLVSRRFVWPQQAPVAQPQVPKVSDPTPVKNPGVVFPPGTGTPEGSKPRPDPNPSRVQPKPLWVPQTVPHATVPQQVTQPEAPAPRPVPPLRVPSTKDN
jgi:hypothetical protein